MAVKNKKRIYVLDTSVIIYDHEAMNHFEEHDVAIPITVLEELDNFKKGNDTKNFAARAFSRVVDELSKDFSLQAWIPLKKGSTKGNFKVLMNDQNELDAERVFGVQKNDHKILNAAMALQRIEANREVILVTKDINLRLKAKALGLPAQDYETGKIKNLGNLYTGQQTIEHVESEKVNEIFEKGFIPFKEVLKGKPESNHFFIVKNGIKSALAVYNPDEENLERVDKMSAYGITPKNAEQTFALHAIMNPTIKLVSLQGVAGTGKTLLALAGSLEQRRNFKQIYLARPIVPLSNKDIGYLPGDIKSKLNPYMEPLWDNLKLIKNQDYKRLEDMVNKEKLIIQPLAYIRGRSLSNVIFIVDEAQNLTPHEVKTIITRAGENTKIIFTGDIHQIDTPYLDSESNGLSYLIDKLKGHSLFSHITLSKGERSELANLANTHL